MSYVSLKQILLDQPDKVSPQEYHCKQNMIVVSGEKGKDKKYLNSNDFDLVSAKTQTSLGILASLMRDLTLKLLNK